MPLSATNTVICYFTEMKGLWAEADFQRRIALLPPAMQAQVLAYTDRYAQQLMTGGKLLLQQLLDELCAGATLHYVKTSEDGKPYIEGGPAFSIAHSGDIVACAGFIGKAIGLDIEYRKPVDTSLYREYLTGREWEVADSLDAFYNIWTRKEAVLKATGQGGLAVLSNIDVVDDVVIERGRRYYLQPVHLKEGYSGCVACTGGSVGVEVTKVDMF